MHYILHTRFEAFIVTNHLVSHPHYLESAISS